MVLERQKKDFPAKCNAVSFDDDAMKGFLSQPFWLVRDSGVENASGKKSEITTDLSTDLMMLAIGVFGRWFG